LGQDLNARLALLLLEEASDYQLRDGLPVLVLGIAAAIRA
jgi:hypothetical protein